VIGVVTWKLDPTNSGDAALPMFPNYCLRKVSELIHEARDRYDWDPMLKWSGSHCLRHGSLTEARAEGGMAAAVARGAHQTRRMSEAYSQTNAARAKTVQAGLKRAQERRKKTKKDTKMEKKAGK
jgi:hypothetical protein